MRSVCHIILVLFLGAIILPSCTKVDEPFYTVKAVALDTNTRTVLLEDYTGHTCVNCAPAAKSANALQEAYKGQVFVIGVHAGSFAKPDPTHYVPYLTADYRCATGNEWYGYSLFNIDQNPKGMVNRAPYKTKVSFVPSEWNNAIIEALKLPKAAIISMNNTFDTQNKTLAIRVETKFLIGFSTPVNLTVCILEDSIHGGQLNSIKPDSTPIIKNYTFMHILRGSVNGTFGEEIAISPASNAVVSKNYSFDFTDKSWIPGHCSVIAFISDATTKEVLHVAKSPVIR